MTVVIVDDEQQEMDLLKMTLERFKEVVILGVYKSGQVTMEKLCLLKPDVVFLDVQMAGLDGIEAFHKIMLQSPQTKVVFVTAQEAYATKAFEMGALDYIIKPVTNERIAKTMKRFEF
jgi:two-component SAPR family response regulator